MIRTFIILLTALSVCDPQNLIFFQNEYDVTMNIAKCTWYNTTFYKWFKADFVLYNRTTRVFNSSWDQIVDFGHDVLIDIQVYKMASNEYRFFPITVRVNACAEYMKNSLGFKDILHKTSNARYCSMKKGVYHIRNLMPDFSKFPPQLPRGSYMMEWTYMYHSYRVCTVDFYGTIKDKPVEWKKLPTRNLQGRST